MSDYGLTLLGFKVKQQSQIISEWEESLRQKFGQNINLAAESVFGEIVGIASEREALIWSLLEAVALSQYPNGAEGTSVDNILALNNLRRLAAVPGYPRGGRIASVRNPGDGLHPEIDNLARWPARPTVHP